MPSIVSTTTTSTATQYANQRKSFYANGRFWVFYCSGSYMAYRTSTDGVNWSSAINVRSSNEGDYFSVWFDGVYVHYAYANLSAIYYRRGTPNSDGSITWSADEQTVPSSANSNLPFVAVDSDGYAWIGYKLTTNYPYIVKSGNNDGTWGTTPEGFPYQLSVSGGSYSVSIIPLTSSKMLAVYASGNATIKAKRWDGSAWGSERATTSAMKGFGAGEFHSALAEGDDVHIAFLKYSTYDILHVKYVYANDNFGSETTVQAAATNHSEPVLCRNSVNGDLYCFWASSPTADHVYYKKRSDSTWDAEPTDWIDETIDHLTGSYNDRFTCFVMAYGTSVGLVYMTKTASPYDVKFAFLTVEVVIVKQWTAALDVSHVLSRPQRKIGYVQALQASHALSRPYRAIKFAAPLNLVSLLVVTKPIGAHATQIFLTLGKSISIKLCG